MKMIKILNLLLITFLLQACASVEIPDFKAYITLPASGDGYYVKTVTPEEGRVSKEEWDMIRKRGIIILGEDWAKLRYSLLKQCLTKKCKQAVGAFDGLFYSLDEALGKIKKAKSGGH